MNDRSGRNGSGRGSTDIGRESAQLRMTMTIGTYSVAVDKFLKYQVFPNYQRQPHPLCDPRLDSSCVSKRLKEWMKMTRFQNNINGRYGRWTRQMLPFIGLVLSTGQQGRADTLTRIRGLVFGLSLIPAEFPMNTIPLKPTSFDQQVVVISLPFMNRVYCRSVWRDSVVPLFIRIAKSYKVMSALESLLDQMILPHRILFILY